MRNSRWSIEGHKDDRGRLIPVLFRASDLEICKLLAPIRTPWGYQYLPTSYFHPLLHRGVAMGRRLDKLTDKPNCYIKRPEQPRNNYRDIIYSLDTNGADELRAAGFDVPRQHLRQLPHELMACLIAASFEHGARLHNIPIITKEWSDQLTFRPDWVPFMLGDTLIIIEADTGSETIYSKEDATTISGKFINYLNLIEHGSRKHFNLKKFLVLFITTRESRCKSMVEVLKTVIDEQNADHDVAEHFAFTSIEYDRYINKIPKLTDWAVSQPYQRAGFPVLQFLKGS